MVIQRVTFVVLGLAPIAFLIGLLHARLARSAVAALVVELRADPGPAELRDALARALRDPSLELVYWLPEFESWADLDGQAGRARRARRRPLDDADRPRRAHVAALLHDPALDDEPELLEAVAAAAAIALENGRLQAELRARLEELRARARGSSRPATPSAGGSSATSTTARSSGSSRSRCELRLSPARLAPRPEEPSSCSPPRARTSPRR